MQLLTSTQSLVLQAITWKVRLERKRGGELVSITAQTVSDFITERFKASVAPKAAHNALKFLVEEGYLTRREFSRSGFKKTFAYGLPLTSEEVPVVFMEKPPLTPQPAPLTSPETPRAVSNDQSVTTSSSNNLKNPISIDRVERTEPSTAHSPPANYRSTGLHSKPTWASGARSLAEILELTGGGELPEICRCKDGFLIRPDA